MPVAYEISQPTLYLVGQYDSFSNYKVTTGYYAEWFKDGYGFYDYRNVRSNQRYNEDVFAYVKQLGFKVTDDPAEADVIVGSSALNQGERGEATVAAVKAVYAFTSPAAQPPELHQEQPPHRSGHFLSGHGGPASGGVSQRQPDHCQLCRGWRQCDLHRQLRGRHHSARGAPRS